MHNFWNKLTTRQKKLSNENLVLFEFVRLYYNVQTQGSEYGNELFRREE